MSPMPTNLGWGHKTIWRIWRRGGDRPHLEGSKVLIRMLKTAIAPNQASSIATTNGGDRHET